MHALLAVDLSHEPERVVDLAAAWAARLGAKVDLAYVTPLAHLGGLVKNVDLQRMVRAEIQRMAIEESEALAALLQRLPVENRGQVHLWEGAAPDEVAERSASYDLVFAGTHGRHGFSHLVLGSIAERIVRWCHTPVLVLRNPPGTGRVRVLCAVDLRERGAEVVNMAVGYARRLDAVVDVAFVQDLALLPPMAVEGPVQALVTEHLARRRGQDELDLHALAERIPPEHRGVTRFEDGDPANRIAAMGVDFELILTGTHGRTGLDRWWLGSVAENILRGADRSVLVLHLGEDADGDARRS